jgi:acetolactate synthase-1/2/3 large subunit
VDDTRTGADLVVDAFEREGVEIVFGYPGGAIMPLHDALFQHCVRHVLVRHEAAAAFAASAYARSTGRTGVCIATSGPGATNLVTGIADAMLDNVPMVAITGQVRSTLMGTDAFQEVDITGITQVVTKRNVVVREARDIPRALADAFRIAAGTRPGPVLVDIPSDVLKERVALAEIPDAPRTIAPRPRASVVQIEAAVTAIRERARPVIIAGGGVRWAGAAAEFRAFCARTGIPHASTLHGLGSADPRDDSFLGMLGMHGWTHANRAIARADLILALGMRFDDRVTGNPKTFAPNARTIVHADIDAAEFNKIVPAGITLHGDLKESLNALKQRLAGESLPSFTAWRDEIATFGGALPVDAAEDGHLPATDVLDALLRAIPSNAIVTTDVGQHQMWTAQRVRPHDPYSFLTSGGLGSMGFGFPAAIGAQFAHPNRPVFAIVGDGGFQMSMAELATLRRYSVPVKIVLIDNRNLGMVRQWQQLFYGGRYASTSLWDNPDFCEIAAAYGVQAIHVDADTSLDDAVDAFVQCPSAALLHATCYPQENCFPMIPSGTSVDHVVESAFA